MISIPEFLTTAPRHLFFTGKGGVGKTSLACASAVLLADKGRRVLLVSTDPASNLDAVLGTKLANSPTPVAGVLNLQAMNIDPEEATREYRERTVGPYRSVLPPQELKLLEERLSGTRWSECAARTLNDAIALAEARDDANRNKSVDVALIELVYIRRNSSGYDFVIVTLQVFRSCRDCIVDPFPSLS
jgi:anion-transporting  ArsA/GET3 family ATPase